MDDLERVKAGLEEWQEKHRQQIEENNHCRKINQPIKQNPQFLSSPFFLMHKFKQMRCEICRYTGGFKYFRNHEMFLPQSPCLVFLLCESCYQRENSSLPIKIDKHRYSPMDKFLTNIESGLSKFNEKSQQSEDVIRKYDFFENKLSSIIWQLIKAVEKKRELVCRKVFDEISSLRSFYLSKNSKHIYDVVLKESICDCRNQCCYCDFTANNEENLKLNCQYFHLKKQQNDIIKKIHLLNTINSSLDGSNNEGIFNGIVKEVQMIIIQQMGNIQKSLNQIIKKTQNFSLINKRFMEKITQQYTFKQNEQVNNFQQLLNNRKREYIQQGVINHMTSDKLSSFSNQITSISLNYMPGESILRRKLKMFDRLSYIEIGCNEVGQLLVEDTIKHHQLKKLSIGEQVRSIVSEVSNLGNIHKKQKEDELLSVYTFKHLKSLTFNCKVPYKQQFLNSIDELTQLEQFYPNWNFVDFFEKFNESTHFLEDKSIINSVAPSSEHLKAYCFKHPTNNLWIGNCGPLQFSDDNQSAIQNDIQNYRQLLNHNEKIERMMFGQLDGRSRKLSSVFYTKLNEKRNVKALFFNKINFDSELLQNILKSNNLLEALYFNSCEGLNVSVIDQICGLQNLKKLAIIQIKEVLFRKGIPSLKTFILENCFDFNGTSIAVLLEKTELKALSLCQCRFFDDELIRDLLKQQKQNGSKLNYLNLGYTNISNQTISLVNQFTQLKSLHIGGTDISLSTLLADLNRRKLRTLSRIEKLSLKDMNQISEKVSTQIELQPSEYYNDIFSNILEHFPLLSHLDISTNLIKKGGNKIINQRAIRFGPPNLIYLTVTDTLYSLKGHLERIDHAGPNCPFADGRLNLQNSKNRPNQSQSYQLQKKKESSGKRQEGLRIIF